MTHTFAQWIYTSIFAGLSLYLIVSCSAGMAYHAYTPGRRLVESMILLVGAGLFYGAMFDHGLLVAHEARLELWGGSVKFISTNPNNSNTGIFHLYAYVAFIPALIAGLGFFLAAHAHKTGFVPKHMAATAQRATQP